LLSLTINTSLAGIYEVRMDADGLRARSVFVGFRHERASLILQLSDQNAIRNGSYTQCVLDCHARNVSNIGRIHPQSIRVSIVDGAEDPVWGAQAFAELVLLDGSVAPGELSGSVSEPLWIDDFGEPSASFPLLAISSALPGMYRFRITLHGPPGEGPSAILTHPFEVKDRVVARFSSQPRPILEAGSGGDGGQVEVSIERWAENTAFLYPAAWIPPVIRIDLVAINVLQGTFSKILSSSAVVLEGGIPSDHAFVRPSLGLESYRSSAGLDGARVNAPFGLYSFAIQGQGVVIIPSSVDQNTTQWVGESEGDTLLKSRVVIVKERPYAVHVIGALPAHVAIGQEIYVRVRVITLYGGVLRGVAVHAEISTACNFQDSSCEDREAKLDRLASGAATDGNGVATVRIIVAAAMDGLYRIRFKSSGVFSVETTPFFVSGLAKNISVERMLVGLEPGNLRFTKEVGQYDFQINQDKVNVRSEFVIAAGASSESSVAASLSLPSVHVLDEYGSSLARTSDVSMRIFTCNREWLEWWEWPLPAKCTEFIQWSADQPVWRCLGAQRDQACDEGVTVWTRFNIDTRTPTGFYYVFFQSEGFAETTSTSLHSE